MTTAETSASGPSVDPNARPRIYLVAPRFPPSYWGLEHFIPLTVYDAFFPPLGLLTLAAYMKLGHERRDRLGERYVPSWAAPAGQR